MIEQNTLVRNGQNPFKKIRQDLMRTEYTDNELFQGQNTDREWTEHIKKVDKTPILGRILREGLNTLITDRTFCYGLDKIQVRQNTLIRA